VLEVCGIASFNLNDGEVEKLFREFHKKYDLEVVYPSTNFLSVEEFVEDMVSRTFEKIKTKINFSDAIILLIAEECGSEYFVTWNTGHFKNRTYIDVLNPREYLSK